MRIPKAVITAAGPSQRALPLQSVIDIDGIQKTVLHVIVDEALHAGVDEVCVVVAPSDTTAYAAAVGEHARRLQFVEQTEPRGYGDAVLCARQFVGDTPFLHLVGDHLYTSKNARRCARQLVEVARAEACAVSAVQPSRESQLSSYGTIGGHLLPARDDCYVVETVIEKPTPTEAEERLLVPGLRAGHYLCFFGMHVLTPAIMPLLETQRASLPADQMVQLSPALDELARRERYLALNLDGRRYNIGARYGTLVAQLALALDGNDRDEVLTQLVELLAFRQQ